jgi:hypothetical protein
MMPTSTRRPAGALGALALTVTALVGPLPPRPGPAAGADGWFYLRGGEIPVAGEPVVSVLAVGDIMTGRGLANSPDLFNLVAGTLDSTDLTIGNLEGTLSDAVPDDPMKLFLPLSTPEELATVGFDLLGIANNHALDAGLPGRVDTRRLLRAAGLEPVETQPVLREVRGLTFAFLAWNDLGAPDIEPLLAAVRQAREQADAVIVLVHWGREYQRHPSLLQGNLAAELLAAGVDVVVGAHSHVVQDLRVFEPETASGRTQVVAYSLGNFAFDQGWDDTGQGLALRLVFDAGGLRAAQAIPVWTAPRPSWMTSAEASSLMARVLPGDRSGFLCAPDGCEPADVPQAPLSGTLRSGAIDLTGDGVNEIVRHQGETADIIQRGRVVWRSPPEWHVRDVALGDPNRDGRYEVVLAVDQDGGTSQPFVIGYRGGVYRELWGGSPVRDPILEVELADVDGDGGQELVAIEDAADGSGRAVTVWRWHGWGFSLVWRSLPGAYQDLVVLPPTSDQPARLSVANR